MKKVLIYGFSILMLAVLIRWILPAAQAQFYPVPGTPMTAPYVTPEPCRSGQGTLPSSQYAGSYCPDLPRVDPNYANNKDANNNYETNCAKTYEEWLADKGKNFWVADPEITSLGKGGERSRQFLLWTLTHPSLDNQKPILDIWRFSRNIAWFLLLIVAIVMGMGIIVGQRNNFNLKIEVSPLIIRLAVLLLYVTFSAGAILLIMQISDVLMEFFIKTLGVRELFNIFFVQDQQGSVIKVSEKAYREFVGCTNWNVNNVEMVKTSKFLVKFTNMTYYFLGIMLIVRKVVLWFLLMVSPFLAILAPFVFIRNIGWIWVGVFFQWVFYGPLFALFLGGLAKIWNSPTFIPYQFDFSRTHKLAEVVYPTSINILYGGPAQQLAIWNTSNYVDTFAEYIIALIMLWVVIILPWWLLRIFRDYCCDGIYAMKNILLSMYDGGKGGPGPSPTTPGPTMTGSTSLKLPRDIKQEITSKIKLETAQDMKQAHTEEIVSSMNIKASNLADIARMESNKTSRDTAAKNIDYLRNPFKADTATDRQRFMALRNELMDRAVKGDQAAKQTLSVVSDARHEQLAQKQEILASLPKMVAVVHTISIKVKLTDDITRNIVRNVVTRVTGNASMVQAVAQASKVDVGKIEQVLRESTSEENLKKTAPELIDAVSTKTGVEKEKVRAVISRMTVVARQDKDLVEKVAADEHVATEIVDKVVAANVPVVVEAEKHIEESVAIPPTVSLEEYEQVKNLWTEQYERGEIPVTENIKDRAEWVEADTVTITNILNKVLSSDEKLRSQGLEEVGYILPIFMVNNMRGDQLIVYLKAKLEAAKQVGRDIQKEAEIKAGIKPVEEFVDIDRPKAEEAAKTMEQHMEQKIPEETIKDENVQKVDEIKDRLQSQVEEVTK